MKLKRVIFFTVLSAIIFLSFPFFFFINKNLAYYAYKEVTYNTIINNVVGQGKNPEKIIITLKDYFYRNLFVPFEAEVVDRDTYNDLMRGIAWCDQRAWGLNTLLGKLGIDNRMIMTINPEGISNHTISEAFIDNKWIFIDPFFGLIIKNKEGKFASYADICKDPSLFYLSPPMIMLREINPKKYELVKNYNLKNIFYNNPREPIIWQNPIKNRDFTHRVIANILNFYTYVFKPYFGYLYQNIYLEFFSPHKENERIYFKARNYHVYNRYQLARELYSKFILKFPEDPCSEDAIFWLGILYKRNKNLELSIDTLKLLLQKYPDTKWKNIAYYYLGFDCELLKNYDLAKDYYWQAIKSYNELSLESLWPTELKVVRRLYNLLELSQK